MADIRVWLGGDGIYETDANWAIAGEPIAGDSMIFDGRTTISLTDDNHTSTAEQMLDMIVEPQYTGQIGTSGAPLRLSLLGTLQYRSPGTLYFENGDTADTTRVIINNPSCHAYLGCETAKIDTIEALRGDVTLTATLTGLLELMVFDANVTILGSNQIDLIRMYGKGNVTCMPEVTLLEHFGTGTFTQLPLSGNVVTEMRIGDGAKVVYQSADTPIVLAQIHNGGFLDVTGARATGAAPLTITTLWMEPRATFRKSSTTVVGTERTL